MSMKRMWIEKIEDIVRVDGTPIAGQFKAGFLKTNWVNALKGYAPTVAVTCGSLLSLGVRYRADGSEGSFFQKSERDGDLLYVLSSDWDKTFSPLLKKINNVLGKKKTALHVVRDGESGIFEETLDAVCDVSLGFGTVNSYNSSGRKIYLDVLRTACNRDTYASITYNQESYKLMSESAIKLMSESAIHILLDYAQELKRRFDKGQGTEAEREEFLPVLAQFHTGMIAPLVRKEMTGNLFTGLRVPALGGYI